MRYASAIGLVMKAPFNDNIPTQTGDVIVNPRNPANPDSNNWLLRAKFPPKNESIIEGLVSFRDGCGPFRPCWFDSPPFISYKLPRILQCISLKYQIQDLRDRLLVKI